MERISSLEVELKSLQREVLRLARRKAGEYGALLEDRVYELACQGPPEDWRAQLADALQQLEHTGCSLTDESRRALEDWIGRYAAGQGPGAETAAPLAPPQGPSAEVMLIAQVGPPGDPSPGSEANSVWTSHDPVGVTPNPTSLRPYVGKVPTSRRNLRGLRRREPAQIYQYVSDAVQFDFGPGLPFWSATLAEAGEVGSQYSFYWQAIPSMLGTPKHPLCETLGVIQIYRQKAEYFGLLGASEIGSSVETFGWKIDYGIPYPFKEGRNIIFNPAVGPGDGYFWDEPGALGYSYRWQYLRSMRQDFELHVACLAGREKGATYGGVSWWHEITAKSLDIAYPWKGVKRLNYNYDSDATPIGASSALWRTLVDPHLRPSFRLPQ